MQWRRLTRLLLLLLLQISTVLFFCWNFLRLNFKPPSASINDSSRPEILRIINRLNELQGESKSPSDDRVVFDRLIFFLLDAWRWDYLFSTDSPMKFIHQKLVDGGGHGFISVAKLPTVTQPCLKALLAGTQPAFLELVDNVQDVNIKSETESALIERASTDEMMVLDNWVRRLKESGKKICAYGDDLWARMFPKSWYHRSDLFYAFDITEYEREDALVTLRLREELTINDRDWDTLILHYLGLDHIGHYHRAHPSKINPKLIQMDEIIREIYEWMEMADGRDSKNSVLIVLGDHGMTADGNHGGASKEETDAAVVFLSPAYQGKNSPLSLNELIDKVQQSKINHEDIATSLQQLLLGNGSNDASYLLKESTGRFLPQLIPKGLETDGQLKWRQITVIKHLLKKCTIDAEVINVSPLIPKLIDVNVHLDDFSVQEFDDFAALLKGVLDKDSLKFNDDLLQVVLVILFLLTSIWIIEYSLIFKISLHSVATVSLILSFASSQFSNSFIEEEHLTWFYWTPMILITWLIDIGFHLPAEKQWSLWSRGLIILMIGRGLMMWNSVGVQGGKDRDIGDWLNENPKGMQVSVLLALIIGIVLYGRKQKSKAALFTYSSLSFLVFMHRLEVFKDFINQSTLAQITLILLLLSSFLHRNHFVNYFYLLALLLNRPHNSLPLSGLLSIGLLLDSLSVLTSNSIIWLRLLFMHFGFFAMGLWHSVSAIDLTMGATFIGSFDMTFAPVFVLLYVLSGPLLLLLSSSSSSSSMTFPDTTIIFTLKSIMTTAIILASYAHRYHILFLPVFSPRLLFEAFWIVVYGFILVPIMALRSK